MRCSFCNSDAVMEMRASGKFLCKKHFNKTFWRRVRRHVSQEKLFDKNEKIGIALSGGKDSTVLLYILGEMFRERKNIGMVAMTIDEGIKNYRESGIATARKNCKKLGIEHKIVSFKKEFGMTLDEMVKQSKITENTPCSICGVLRRYLLNKAAKEENCTKLATGHNLDDEAQTILMNFMRGDVKKMARLGAKVGVKKFEGFVQRVKPLRIIPEKESSLFAMLNGMETDESTCPYGAEAFRSSVTELLNEFESRFAGVKYSIVHSYDKLAPSIKKGYRGGAPQVCQTCGELTSQKLCKTCHYLWLLKQN